METKLDQLKNKMGLVCEGGGVLGVAELGALIRLDELGIKISQFKYFAGTSVGSIITSALACGGTIEYITQVLQQLQFDNFKDDDWGVVRDTYRLWTCYGWHKGEFLEKWAYDILGAITGNPAITFEEVYKRYGNYLVIPVMKNYEETVYYDRFTVPTMPVFKAIRRSAGIPLFYQADMDDHDMYVDGGVLDNYPFHKLDEIIGADKVLGLKLMSTKQLHEISYGIQSDPPSTLLQAVMKLITALRNQALRVHIKTVYWDHTIKIDVEDMKSTDFDLTLKQKEWLINQGRDAVDKFLVESD